MLQPSASYFDVPVLMILCFSVMSLLRHSGHNPNTNKGYVANASTILMEKVTSGHNTLVLCQKTIVQRKVITIIA